MKHLFREGLNTSLAYRTDGGDATTPPLTIKIVIKGVEVLPHLGNTASACAVLIAVIHALNSSYLRD